MRLDLTDHVIERPGQLADLVPAASLGTDRVILVHGDGAHHAGQLLNGIGDEALQARRQQQGHEEGARQHAGQDGGIGAQ